MLFPKVYPCFIKTGTVMIPTDSVRDIDYSNLINLEIQITTKGGITYLAEGINALEIVLLLKPSAIEGVPSIKWQRHVWAAHNLIGHPLMQLMALFGLTGLGLKIHDMTVPSVKKLK